jgi:hypothetical protein
MANYLGPEVTTPERPPAAPTIPTLATAVTGVAGVTERGPVRVPTLVLGWDQYKKKFGGFTEDAELTKQMFCFFTEVGRAPVYISRVVHYTTIGDAGTKQSVASTGNIDTAGAATQGSVTSSNPQTHLLVPADDLDIKVDAGAADTATFNATAAAVTGSGGTYPTGWSSAKTLLVTLDSGAEQTIDFPGTSHTLAEVIDVINPLLVGGYADDNGGQLRITSDTKGTGSRVEIGAGTGNTELGFAGTEDVSGTGNVASIAAVTGAEIKTIVEAAVSGCTVTTEGTGESTIKTDTVGSGGSIQVEGGTARTKIGFDNAVHSGSAAAPGTTAVATAASDGTHGDNLVVRIAAASSGDSDEFNWQTLESGIVRETFPNLSTVLTDARYWETIVNHVASGSQYLVLTDSLTGTPPNNRPINGDYPLSGGNNGLTGLADADFVGDSAAKTGLYAFDTKNDVTLVGVPGNTATAVTQAVADYNETAHDKQTFGVVGPPADQTGAAARDYWVANLKGRSKRTLGAWPRIKITNPAPTVYTSDADGLITVDPAGALFGMIARMDRDFEGGVHKAPSGSKRGYLIVAKDLETEEALDPAVEDILFPNNLNVITWYEGARIHLNGPKTMDTSGSFPSAGERRGSEYLKRLIRLTIRGMLHDDNTTELQNAVDRAVLRILKAEMEVGAFTTRDPRTAFFTDFGPGMNTPDVIAQNRFRGKVGWWKAKPAYYFEIPIDELLQPAA